MADYSASKSVEHLELWLALMTAALMEPQKGRQKAGLKAVRKGELKE